MPADARCMKPSWLHEKSLITLLQHSLGLCILALSIQSKSSPNATQSFDQKQWSTHMIRKYGSSHYGNHSSSRSSSYEISNSVLWLPIWSSLRSNQTLDTYLESLHEPVTHFTCGRRKKIGKLKLSLITESFVLDSERCWHWSHVSYLRKLTYMKSLIHTSGCTNIGSSHHSCQTCVRDCKLLIFQVCGNPLHDSRYCDRYRAVSTRNGQNQLFALNTRNTEIWRNVRFHKGVFR